MMELPLSPSEISLTWSRNIRRHRSPFTGRSQTQHALNEWWEGEMRLQGLTDEEAAQWRAWLVGLGGRAGTFRLGPVLSNAGAGGEPVVDGSGQRGTVLRTRGWGSNNDGLLLPGDHIEVDERLYFVCNTGDSDSSGVAEVAVWPRLRTAPADGSQVIIDNPRGRFRLAEDESGWDIRPGRFTDFSIPFVEAL